MVAKYVCVVIGVFGALYRMTSADWAECIVIGNILFFGLLYVATDDGQPTMRTVKKFEEELRGYDSTMDWKVSHVACYTNDKHTLHGTYNMTRTMYHT